MKNQALFCLKDKGKKLKCHLLQFLIGALRVKQYQIIRNVEYTCRKMFNMISGILSP